MVRFPYIELDETEIIAEIQNSANKVKQHIIDNPEVQNFTNKVKQHIVDNPEVQNFANKVRQHIDDNKPALEKIVTEVQDSANKMKQRIVDNPKVQNFANKVRQHIDDNKPALEKIIAEVQGSATKVKQHVVDNQPALEKLIAKVQNSANKARQHIIDKQPALKKIFIEPSLNKVVASLTIGYLFGRPITYGLLYLIGFRPRGILKSSPAAWAMSFHRDATPRGGIVANFQSIGAVGLRFAGSFLSLTTLSGSAITFCTISAIEAINILCNKY
ncbi:guanylate cyclase soluble subunit alpha-2-like [Gigaspora margarita]|uniref:Guanylate cyclase soluble subunit alpha-2-like n=1 Tax=Gigaspora margarita TaxID=4874 RepID=A0A8H3WY33_GIGMA|nr:guanylate cyclase soluble subunit alpha-2-like [Gigaspora margarita]